LHVNGSRCGVAGDDIKNAIDGTGVDWIIIRERPNPRCIDKLKASGDICTSADIGDITNHTNWRGLHPLVSTIFILTFRL
jgi:hypothetical protein